MRLVLDTNVVISALVFGGEPRRVWESVVVRKSAIGVSSDLLIGELLGVLAEKFDFTPERLAQVRNIVETNFEMVAPRHIKAVIQDDPDDDVVLATALEGRADMVISGDHHLLAVGQYQGIPIVPAADVKQ
jgi:putative PIN family toxin of toxin-antitoxin system